MDYLADMPDNAAAVTYYVFYYVYRTDVYYLDWAHIIFHQYYCLRVNRVQSAILKMVEIRILQRHLSL